MTRVLLLLAAATVGGLVARGLNVPGGLVVGAMIGAGSVSLLSGEIEIVVPDPVQTAALVVIGAVIGAQLTPTVLASLPRIMVPAVLSALIIIACGVAIAFVLQAAGLAPPGVLLATSPGALSVISALAVERGTGPVEVAVFHTVRVVLVILTMPLLLALLSPR
jgi:uncharacterized protein